MEFLAKSANMKKIKNILRYAGFSLAALVVLIVLFLFIFYSVLDSGKNKEMRELMPVSSAGFMSGEAIPVKISDSCLNLIPVPRKVKLEMGNYTIPARIEYSNADSLQPFVSEHILTIPGLSAGYSKNEGNMVFRYKTGLNVQGYNLSVKRDKIIVEYSTRQGTSF